jgi:hypothetical protein
MKSDPSKTLKVYLAGSFAQKDRCVEAGSLIRDAGMLCYVFCDEGSEAYPHSMKLREERLIETFTPMTAIRYPTIVQIYTLNMMELISSDVVVLILPCGKSAHLEAGLMKGLEGKLIIFGEMLKGEFDAMYCMADLVTDNFNEVIAQLANYNQEKGHNTL